MLIQRKHPLFLAHPVCVATDYIAPKEPEKTFWNVEAHICWTVLGRTV